MVNKKRKVDEDSEENPSKKSKATKSISSKKNIKEDEIIDETKKGKKIFLENGFVL